MICRICSRDLDIPADAVLLRQRYGIALYRFPPNGDVHEFRVITRTEASNRKPKLPLAQVVKVPAPKVEPEAKPVIDVASAASTLKEHFRRTEVIETPEYLETEYSEPEYPKVGDVLDFIVVSWTTEDHGGFHRQAIGLARIPRGSQERGRTDGCFFSESDIVSEGVETLHVGSRIRARLAPAVSGAHPFTLRSISIYQD